MNDGHGTERPTAAGKAGPLTSDLKARIARAQGEREVAGDGKFATATRDMSALSRGLRLGSEFVAAILVGGGMGYLLDQWLGTSPWLFLAMIMLGFVAGVLNVVRAASQMNKAAMQPPVDPGPAGDDENK